MLFRFVLFLVLTLQHSHLSKEEAFQGENEQSKTYMKIWESWGRRGGKILLGFPLIEM